MENGFLPRVTRLAILHEVLWWMMYGGKPEDLATVALQSNVSCHIMSIIKPLWNTALSLKYCKTLFLAAS